MGNKNYEKGRRREYAAIRASEAVGYLGLRSAGSHGPFDVILFGRNEIRCLQLKCDCGITAAERETLRAIQLPANTTKEIWYYETGKSQPVKIEVIP